MILNAERPSQTLRSIRRPMTPAELRLLSLACRTGIAHASGTAQFAAGRLKDRGYCSLDVNVLPDAIRGRHQFQYVLRPTKAGRDAYEERKAANEALRAPKPDHT